MSSVSPARDARGAREYDGRPMTDSETPEGVCHVRALLEPVLDKCAWPWCRRRSVVTDETVLREERAA